MEPGKKKTPNDTTEFEREQLRFFLSRDDVSDTLAEINPSLAWLPELAKMKVIENSAQLAPWIERNFADAEAVREVAANLNFFDRTAAELIQFRLNHQIESLPPVLAKSWQLIIRHIRDTSRGALQSEWFELEPRLKRGDLSSEVIEKLAGILRPKLRIGKRSWYDEIGSENLPERPSDLMSIDFEVEDGVTDSEILAAWPKNPSARIEQRLLITLTDALNSALEDAIDANVERNDGYGISDADVPSIAAHRQNEYRTGFLPIVRVIAEIWSRLANSEPALALPYVEHWSSSPLKLNQRLALFAAADTAVSADAAADVLLALPQGLLFLTNTSVEVFRLVRTRWKDFSTEKRAKIEDRIIAGPPRDLFESEVDAVVDRSRYDLLGEMERSGLDIGQAAKALLAGIKSKYPIWELRPPEQAGFHIWHEGGGQIIGNPQGFEAISDESLIDEARKAADKSDFLDGDDWQAFCQSNPQRALRGLETKAREGQWPVWAWNPFLWAGKKLDAPDGITMTGELLLKFPDEEFPKVAGAASWWLNEKAKELDENILWPLWDKIATATALWATEDLNA
jgi:hypothetical protein